MSDSLKTEYCVFSIVQSDTVYVWLMKADDQPPYTRDLYSLNMHNNEICTRQAPEYSKDSLDPPFGHWSKIQCSFQLGM